MKNESRIALVVGATGKIGSQICIEMARRKFDIYIHYNTSENKANMLADDIESFGGTAHVVKANISDNEECMEMLDKIYSREGRVNSLVCCASVFIRTKLGEVSYDEWKKIMDTNLSSAFFLSQAVGMKMKQDGIKGNIIHFSDIAANHPYGDYIPYCMSKAAIDSMVKGLALKLAPEVRVNAVAPYLARRSNGLSEDDIKCIEKMPMKSSTDPKEIAKIVGVLIEDAYSVTGQTINIDGGRTLTW